MDIVNDQCRCIAEPVPKAGKLAGAKSFQKGVGKGFRRDLDQAPACGVRPHGVRQTVQQMRFAQPDSTVQNQRIERGSSRFDHLKGGCMGHPVAGADNEIIEPASGLHRCRPEQAWNITGLGLAFISGPLGFLRAGWIGL